MIFWLIWGLAGVAAELYAIKTGEKKFITLSRTIWRVLKLEDKGFDRAEKIVRWICTVFFSLVAIWAVLHLFWGPQAFGIG